MQGELVKVFANDNRKIACGKPTIYDAHTWFSRLGKLKIVWVNLYLQCIYVIIKAPFGLPYFKLYLLSGNKYLLNVTY